jgi:hypothetical protein
VEIERDPEERTYNTSILVRGDGDWGFVMLEKGRGGMEGMS